MPAKQRHLGILLILIFGVLIFLGSRLRFLTAAANYHLRHGSTVRIVNLVTDAPPRYFPVWERPDAVVLVSGLTHMQANIWIQVADPSSQSTMDIPTEYPHWRENLRRIEHASAVTGESTVPSAIGPIRCFELRPDPQKLVAWCATDDFQTTARYEGSARQVKDFYAVMKALRHG